MKIYIYDKGDEEVNISPNEMTIEVNHGYEEYSDDEISDIRTNMKEFAKSHFDFMDSTEVLFDNECQDCFSKLVDNKCVNENCPMKIENQIAGDALKVMSSLEEKDAETKPEGLEKM